MSKVSKRRLVRERVLQLLYAVEMNDESLSYLTDAILSDITNESDMQFAKDLINKVIINKEELDDKISKRITNWEMGRVALIDKILLRMGLCELFYFEEIPPKVSINESIEIAKEFSTGGSGKFINGILDAVLSELKESGKLDKKGRGLVDETLSKQNDKD